MRLLRKLKAWWMRKSVEAWAELVKMHKDP
jgi:hypothetical protein